MTHSEAPAGWILPCERSRKSIPRAAPADNVLHKEALHTDPELNQRRIQTHQQSDPAVRSARGNTSHEAEAGNHSTHGKQTSHVLSGPEETSSLLQKHELPNASVLNCTTLAYTCYRVPQTQLYTAPNLLDNTAVCLCAHSRGRVATNA